MSSESLYLPDEHPGLPWLLKDMDKTDFPLPYQWLASEPDVITAPWGEGGTQQSVSFSLTLTFDGIQEAQGSNPRSGVFTLVATPKDAMLLREFRKRAGSHGVSPRDYLKRVVLVLSKFPMYPGAQLTINGAHHGMGGTRLYVDFSGVAGWQILVARRQTELNLFNAANGPLTRLMNWISGNPPAIPPDSLDSTPPQDLWRLEGRDVLIDELSAGTGLDAGPLRLAGESLMRRLCRDVRIAPVASKYPESGSVTIAGHAQPSGSSRRPSTVTMIPL